jgi:hypothetical protein
MREHGIVWNRRVIRINVLDTVDAELRIIALGARRVRTHSRKVLLLDLCPDGLRFKTTLWLPPDEDWTVALRFTLEGIPLETQGTIARASCERNWWLYEVNLHADPVMRMLITRVLNQRLRSRAPMLYRMHESYRKHLW